MTETPTRKRPAGTGRPPGRPKKRNPELTYFPRTMFFDDALLADLDAEAEQQKLSRSQAVRVAVADWLRRSEKKREHAS